MLPNCGTKIVKQESDLWILTMKSPSPLRKGERLLGDSHCPITEVGTTFLPLPVWHRVTYSSVWVTQKSSKMDKSCSILTRNLETLEKFQL